MPRYSPAQIAQVWENNGGDPLYVVTAVAVALAESDGQTDIVGPTDDWGLWQINGVHFGQRGINANTVLNPDVNAQAAIWISTNGTNWAPWATCYANINATGWTAYKSSPDVGSPAYNRLAEAAAGIGQNFPSPAGPILGGCAAGDVGIPNSQVAGLQPGEVRHVHTCPGGSFDAGDLMPGLTVEGYNANGLFAVTSNYPGFMIPGNIEVSIYLSGTVGAPSTPSPTPTPTIPQPPAPIPSGCGPNEIGIPNAVVANLSIEQPVSTTTCPGGDFDAGTLMDGLRVSGWKGGAPFIVTNAQHGFMIPRSTNVIVTRYSTSSGGGAPQQPSPVPPVYVPPPGPLPTGNGKNQLQTGWSEVSTYFNSFAPFVVSDIANFRNYLRGLAT